MQFYLTLPILFFRFWFLEAPFALFQYFYSVNTAFLQLVSLTLLVKTFFTPWKNEYRKGLVGFSIGFGMVIKSFVIVADFILLLVLCLCEVFGLLAFLVLPIGTFFLLVISL